jgi:hypothetical protein
MNFLIEPIFENYSSELNLSQKLCVVIKSYRKAFSRHYYDIIYITNFVPPNHSESDAAGNYRSYTIYSTPATLRSESDAAGNYRSYAIYSTPATLREAQNDIREFIKKYSKDYDGLIKR